jgi:hypothetical protein
MPVLLKAKFKRAGPANTVGTRTARRMPAVREAKAKLQIPLCARDDNRWAEAKIQRSRRDAGGTRGGKQSQKSRPREHRRDADNAQDACATREKAKAPAGGLRYERRTAKADPSLCSG